MNIAVDRTMNNKTVLKELVKRIKDHNIEVYFEAPVIINTTSRGCLVYLFNAFGEQEAIQIYCSTKNLLEQITTLAHEFGHYLDFTEHGNEYHESVCNATLEFRQSMGKMPGKVIGAEYKAWDNADTILTEIGFDITTKGYIKLQKKFLSSYQKYI
jgi:hypothetical protein